MLNAVRPKLLTEAVFIDRLKQSGTERLVNLNRQTDHALGQWIPDHCHRQAFQSEKKLCEPLWLRGSVVQGIRRDPSPIAMNGNTHNGILSCFFQGFFSCLLRSMARARQRRRRVPCGVMTSSMKPRAPATKGLANLVRYSSVRWAILAGSPMSPRKMISTAPFGPITAISAEGQA